MASLVNSLPFVKTHAFITVKTAVLCATTMWPLVTSIFQVLITGYQTTHSHITDHSDLHSQHCMNLKSHLLVFKKDYYWTLSSASWALSMTSPFFSKSHVMLLSAVTSTMWFLSAFAIVLVLVAYCKHFLNKFNHFTGILLNDRTLWFVQFFVSVCNKGDFMQLL